MEREQRSSQGQNLQEHSYLRENRGKVNQGGRAGMVRVRSRQEKMMSWGPKEEGVSRRRQWSMESSVLSLC